MRNGLLALRNAFEFFMSAAVAVLVVGATPSSANADWTAMIVCGEDVVIDRNEYDQYQVVLKNDLADIFSAVHRRNPRNENEIIVSLRYCGPQGCEDEPFQRKQFASWIDGLAIEILGPSLILIESDRGNLRARAVVEDCAIPAEFVP